MGSSRLLFYMVVLGGFLVMDPVGAFSGVDAGTLSASQGDPSTLEQVAHLPLEPLSLQDAIALAMAHNPGAAAAGWEAAAAEARRGQVSAERLPRITLTGSYTRHLDEQRLLPVRQPGDPAVLSRDILAGDVLFSLPLLTGGRLSNQIEAADLSHEAARHGVAWIREDLVFQVTSLIREHTAIIRPPRALWVPFALGHPFGAPGDAGSQGRVLLAALRLLEADAGPVLEDFPDQT